MKTTFLLLLISFLILPPSAVAQSEADEREASAQAFEHADKLLNDIYRKLLGILSPDEQAQLRAEQRAWIPLRDRRADKAAESLEGSNYYNRARHDTMMPLTVDRYAELLKKYLERYIDVMMSENETD